MLLFAEFKYPLYFASKEDDENAISDFGNVCGFKRPKSVKNDKTNRKMPTTLKRKINCRGPIKSGTAFGKLVMNPFGTLGSMASFPEY